MADYVDTKVSNLVINNLTQEKYDELLASGQINPDELYCTPDNIEELLNAKADLAIFDAIYPVGSIYIGTQSTCPMAIAIPSSTWELVSAGRALWTGNGSNGNTTIAAGLPNITGTVGSVYATPNKTVSGAFTATSVSSNRGAGNLASLDVSFNASRSSSIYGQSSTVQPPAYVVNVWRRTA